MRAKELVPILADIYGVPFETAFAIDRSLAEAGLRTKNRGRSWPEMTRREAVIFLIACMTVQRATKAAEEVRPWLAAQGGLTDEPEDPTLYNELEAPEPTARNPHMQKVVRRLNLCDLDELGIPVSANLMDALLAACAVLEEGFLSSEALKFEACISHGWAALSINDPASGGYSEMRFQTEAGAADPVSYETQIARTAVVYGDALLALAVRTAPETD